MKQLLVFASILILIGCAARNRHPTNINEPIVVGILYFENISDSQLFEGLGTQLTQMFASEFQNSEQLKVVEREQLDKILDELKLNRSALVNPMTAQQIGRLLGAQALYYGSYMEWHAQLQINGHLFRVETAELMASAGGSCSNVTDLRQLRELVHNMSREIRQQVQEHYPTYLADIYHSRGQRAEAAGRLDEAREHYGKALTAHSRHGPSKRSMERLSQD